MKRSEKKKLAKKCFFTVFIIFIFICFVVLHEETHAQHCRYFNGVPSITYELFGSHTVCNGSDVDKDSFLNQAANLETQTYFLFIIMLMFVFVYMEKLW